MPWRVLPRALAGMLAGARLDHVQISIQDVDAASADRIAGYDGARLRSQNYKVLGGGIMSYLSNVINERPMVRVSASVILAFCCAMPFVWLFSNLVVYGLRSFL